MFYFSIQIMDKLAMYLARPFVRYALIVGVLIALCSSLLGVTLVLKRFSFIGDGLSHVAFGAISIAAVLNLTNEMLIVLPITILSAILLLRTGQNARIKGDAAMHSEKADRIFKRKPIWGAQLAYAYNSILGPLGGSIGWSDLTKQVSIYINLGFEF